VDSLNGQVRVKTLTAVSGGAGNTTIPVRPDTGKIWKILLLWAYQASGGNRAAGWYWTDPETSGGTPIGATIAALSSSIPLMFPGMVAVGAAGGDIVPIEAPWATNNSYPTFLWTATAGAENGYVKALVIEYAGTGKTG
jgi:hypothetical protein